MLSKKQQKQETGVEGVRMTSEGHGGTDERRERREKAMKWLKSGRTRRTDHLAENLDELLHELEIYQAELEVQNEELRRAQLELTEARDRYQNLYEFAPIGYLTLDAKGVIRDANLTGAALLGVERNKLIGMRAESLALREDHDTLYVFLRNIAADFSSKPIEVRFRRGNEGSFFARLEAAALAESGRDASGGFRLALTDITYEKNAERERQASEALYRALAANLPGGAAFLVDGSLRYVVAEGQALTDAGYAPEDLEGKPVREALEADIAGAHEEHYRQALAGKPFSLEHESHGRHYATRGVPIRDDSGAVTHALAVSYDITERRLSEKALRQSESRFHLLADTAGYLLHAKNPQDAANVICAKVMEHLDCQAFFNFLVDDETGRLHLNACAGIPEEEKKKIEWLDFGVAVCGCVAQSGKRIIVEDVQHLDDPRNALIKGFGIQAYCCHPLISHDRLLGTLSFGTRTRTRFSDHEIELMRAVTDQVVVATQRLRAEQALKNINRSLVRRVAKRTNEIEEQSRQLRALAAQLSQTEHRERKRLAKVLHDHIQQLLVAARMQVEWITRDQDAVRMHATANSVENILHEALEASRSLAIDLSPPVLHEAGLGGGLHWLAERMKANHQLQVGMQIDNSAEPRDEATRLLLFECARELLLNVVKYAHVSEAHIELLRTNESHITLVVQDHGNGFDPEALKNRNASDLSFGLFSIRERVAHLGGSVEIETAPGEGTKITLTAPASLAPGPAQAKPVPHEPASPSRAPIPGQTEPCRVMIVDDHKIMREGLAGLLRFEPDITVIGEADEGRRAIELAVQLQPDVILMDINLGVMSGVEATREILQRQPNIKIIGLSMHEDSEVALAMREAGAVSYLTKGAPAQDVVAAIRACASGESDRCAAAQTTQE